MLPTISRIAQTSTEAKKQHKKNGPLLPARQQKQLERALELDQRAARARDAENRRKATNKKRKEKEEKEARARQQTGVGLATQLIRYSHTQAKLKSGMEAFLGVKKRDEQEKRKRDMELTTKLEAIAADIEKEPWDDDESDDLAADLSQPNTSFGDQWADDDLDDDSLLEAHDLLVSDPVRETVNNAQLPLVPPPIAPASPKPTLVREDVDFTRTHGPINRTLEAILDTLPEPLLELLSQDLSMKHPDWDPPLGLLYKLNPVGLPPHRLRIKVGCVVTLLRDLNSSSPLSKSQYLRVVRADDKRLECFVLDGQLEGTKIFLTRVAFLAKYKNQEQYPFQRTQFPIRLTTDYTPTTQPRKTVQHGFKLPSIPSHVRPPNTSTATKASATKPVILTNPRPGFKLPGLPASKSTTTIGTKLALVNKPEPPICQLLDGWDDFLESGTQIARELSVDVATPVQEPKLPVVASTSLADCLPVFSTQDFDFSLEDLDEACSPTSKIQSACDIVLSLTYTANSASKELVSTVVRSTTDPTMPSTQELGFSLEDFEQETSNKSPTKSIVTAVQPSAKQILSVPPSMPAKPLARLSNDTILPISKASPSLSSIKIKSPATKPKSTSKLTQPKTAIDLSMVAMLRPSQRPPSVSDRPGLKRKAPTIPTKQHAPPPKRLRVPESRPALSIKSALPPALPAPWNDFIISTQDAASFFDDDDNLSFGSPPIVA